MFFRKFSFLKSTSIFCLAGNSLIYYDVSITARDLFMHSGFEIEKQQLKRSKERDLINFRMIKQINK